jgi:hypothetical protein
MPSVHANNLAAVRSRRRWAAGVCWLLVACGSAGAIDTDAAQVVAPVHGPRDGGSVLGETPARRDAGALEAGTPDATTPDASRLDAGPPVAAGSDGGGPPIGRSVADYRDPGKGPWERAAPEDCGLDLTRLADSAIAHYALFRHGKLCHLKGDDSVGKMYSATKTMAAAAIGRAAYLTREVPRTGPGTGTILHEDKAIDWLGSVSYNRDATLAHVMAMCGHSQNLAYGQKRFDYDGLGGTQINTLIPVTEKAVKQLARVPTVFADFVAAELFARLGMSHSRYQSGLGISAGWEANLSDMGKLGTLLLHEGYYGGEWLVARDWVYRMSHPAFEDANTAYGQLTWLSHRGHAAGQGGNLANTAQKDGDPCTPPAFWPRYPHIPSGAPDCRSNVGPCDTQLDVGVFSAEGLNGQFIVMHPGLDLVIAARDFGGDVGPPELWAAVRPALVARDPVYQGDEAAFCAAYGAGAYAPDLVLPRHAP